MDYLAKTPGFPPLQLLTERKNIKNQYIMIKAKQCYEAPDSELLVVSIEENILSYSSDGTGYIDEDDEEDF